MSEFLSLFHSVISQALARRGADRRHSDATTTASWSFAFISLYTPRSHHRVRNRVARNNRATVFSLSLSLSLLSLFSKRHITRTHKPHSQRPTTLPSRAHCHYYFAGRPFSFFQSYRPADELLSLSHQERIEIRCRFVGSFLSHRSKPIRAALG